MKKKALIIIAILVILLIGALAVGINIYNNIANNSEISKQGAIEIALENANVKESDAASQKRHAELKEELFNLRFQLAINQLENPMRIVAVKKDIARIKTVIRENEIKNSTEL